MTDFDAAADALTIARLAGLSTIELDRVRRAEAAKLGIRPETLDSQVRAARRAASGPEPGDDRPPEFSDEALALRFTARHADDLRYVAAWGRWHRWTGSVWRPDDTLHVFDLARAICREAAAQCPDPHAAPRIASAQTVAAVERLARADRRHAATSDQWDFDPWLLNTPGGIVDLRTGERREHRREDYVTKITAVAPGGDYPLWRAFLSRITNGGGDLHDFLQRAAGHALTGITREHALFFGYGTGANGKGTFLNTVSGILGAYATTAPMETFEAGQNDRHPTELAMLRGSRLVTATETEEGRRWAESRIKALTGGDPISARFMRQDFFSFVPQFKLFITGNHKPGLRGVDEAIRRRLHLIPFEVTIPPAERDGALADKLRAEWPGILAWMIEGCSHWQRIGLAPPQSVRDATDRYLETEDAIGIWLAERCWAGGQYGDTLMNLFSSWKDWAETAGEYVGQRKRFSQALEARGFVLGRQGGTGRTSFVGVAVRAEGAL
ncbi:MAG: phage/plasmid primase, P4 family [Acetobacteraceae bacterium]